MESAESRKLSTTQPQRKISTVPESDIYTLTRHLMIQQQMHEQATGDFTLLMTSIQLACKFICSKVTTAGISHVIGIMGGDKNASGDTQKKLDVIADEVFIKALRSSGKVCVMVTEEQEKPIVCSEYLDAKYVVSFDPLDGSSNIDANVSIGSIFGIWKRVSPLGTQPTQEDIQQSGDKCISSGYCLYGSSCIMVIANDAGVNGYTLDPNLGEFILTHPRMRMPQKGNQYSINEGNSIYWNPPIKNYINDIKNPPKGKSVKSLRYIGSMVADVHRVILYGGTFLYPTDQKSKDGKLRLLYEAIPMSMIIEKSGGQAITDNPNAPCQRIMELKPNQIHQRCGVILGSKVEIQEIIQYFQNNQEQQPKEEKKQENENK